MTLWLRSGALAIQRSHLCADADAAGLTHSRGRIESGLCRPAEYERTVLVRASRCAVQSRVQTSVDQVLAIVGDPAARPGKAVQTSTFRSLLCNDGYRSARPVTPEVAGPSPVAPASRMRKRSVPGASGGQGWEGVAAVVSDE